MILSKVKALDARVSLRVLNRNRSGNAPLILALFAGCAVWGIVFLISRPPARSPGVAPPNHSTSPELVFRSTMIFDGKTEDGVRFADYHYKASDCAQISHKTIFFKSLARTQEEIERSTELASTIIERGPSIDAQSRRVGERVLLQFEANDEYQAHAKVIWNNNSDFHSIAGPSLQRVLEFEKALSSQSGRILSRIDDVQLVTFTSPEVRDGKTEEGFYYSEKQFRSSDCETITARTEYFPSHALAQEEMQKKLKESTNIIERGPKLNASGQPVGERAVAMFKAEPRSEYLEDTIVIWTVNSELHSIKGLFAHILELEKRDYQYK